MMIDKLVRLIACLLPPLLVGYIGGLFTRTSVSVWYQELNKPLLTPPDWVFFPVWTALYLLMGLSCFLLVEKGKLNRLNLNLYSFQLLFNLLWTFLFFFLQNPTLGLVAICILLVLVGLMVRSFIYEFQLAGYLQIPYLAWLTYATYLNFEIWRLNFSGG